MTCLIRNRYDEKGEYDKERSEREAKYEGRKTKKGKLVPDVYILVHATERAWWEQGVRGKSFVE